MSDSDLKFTMALEHTEDRATSISMPPSDAPSDPAETSSLSAHPLLTRLYMCIHNNLDYMGHKQIVDLAEKLALLLHFEFGSHFDWYSGEIDGINIIIAVDGKGLSWQTMRASLVVNYALPSEIVVVQKTIPGPRLGDLTQAFISHVDRSISNWVEK